MQLPIDSVFVILKPLQVVLEHALPPFIKQGIQNPGVRDKAVDAADIALLAQAPEAKLVPETTRKSIIRGALALIVDHALLPEE